MDTIEAVKLYADTKKILVLDFDGVIHSYTSDWEGPTKISDPPVEGAFEFIEQALEEFRVAIFSSRSHQKGAIEAMKEWFLEHGMEETLLSKIEFPSDKPPAHVFLDDHGMNFSGTFPEIEEIKEFKSWAN